MPRLESSLCACRRKTGWRGFPATVSANGASRVNDQFRVCFVWRDGAARDVEIVDYH